MHIFYSRENIKTCIFTAVKIQYLIFSRERNRKIGTTFIYFLKATLYGISVFLRETTIGVSYFYGNETKSQSRLEAK